MGSTGAATAMNTGNVAVSAGQAVDIIANERATTSRVDNVQLRTDTYNRNLLTTGRYADMLNSGITALVPFDKFAGTVSDFIRIARDLGYDAVYDRGNDEVRVGRRR